MPLYEYECENCGHRFEVIQKFADAPLVECTKCKGTLRKLLSSPAIQFKGSGWYITDYANKNSTGAAASKPEGGPSGEKSSSSESSSSSNSSDSASKTDGAPKASTTPSS